MIAGTWAPGPPVRWPPGRRAPTSTTALQRRDRAPTRGAPTNPHGQRVGHLAANLLTYTGRVPAMPIAYLGLGSNLGDRRRNLERAMAQLDGTPGVRVKRVSSFRVTAP